MPNTTVPIATMLKEFCDAVEQRDGKRFAMLFTQDGVYHDAYYGAFSGREHIALGQLVGLLLPDQMRDRLRGLAASRFISANSAGLAA